MFGCWRSQVCRQSSERSEQQTRVCCSVLISFTYACIWLDAKPSAAALSCDAARRWMLAGAGVRRVDSESRWKEWARGVNNASRALNLPTRRAINTFLGHRCGLARADWCERGNGEECDGRMRRRSDQDDASFWSAREDARSTYLRKKHACARAELWTERFTVARSAGLDTT